jgi:hypothetical protein
MERVGVRGRSPAKRKEWKPEDGKNTHDRFAVGQIAIGIFSLLGRRRGTSCVWHVRCDR